MYVTVCNTSYFWIKNAYLSSCTLTHHVFFIQIHGCSNSICQATPPLLRFYPVLYRCNVLKFHQPPWQTTVVLLLCPIQFLYMCCCARYHNAHTFSASDQLSIAAVSRCLFSHPISSKHGGAADRCCSPNEKKNAPPHRMWRWGRRWWDKGSCDDGVRGERG